MKTVLISIYTNIDLAIKKTRKYYYACFINKNKSFCSKKQEKINVRIF